MTLIGKHRSFQVVALLAAAGSLVIGCATATSAKPASAKGGKDIVDTAAAAGDFGTLLTAAKAAGLVDTLKSDGPLTVFAPTDAAFAKLPEGTVASLLKPENRAKLQAILKYHVVPGMYPSGKVVKATSLKTAQGESISVKVVDAKVHVDNATVVAADVNASNGVIHVIDTVILPKS